MDVKMSIFAIFRRQRRHRKSRRSAAVGCAEGGRTPAAELCHARSFIKKAQSPAHGTYEMVSARALWLDCQMVAVTQRGSALHRTVGSR